MSAELKNFTLIRNERQKEEAQRVRKDFASECLRLLSMFDEEMTGFSITVWSDSASKSSYSPSSDVPKGLIGEYVKRDIEREVGLQDAANLIDRME